MINSYRPYGRQPEIFDVVLDLEITVPKGTGREFYVSRLYQDASGVSLIISNSNGVTVACVYNCKTFDRPVALDTGEVPGISAHVLLSPCVFNGNLIDSPVLISPSLVSEYTPAELPSQELTLIVDGDTIFRDILSVDTTLTIGGILSGTVSGNELTVSCNTDIGALYDNQGSSAYRPLRMVNFTTPSEAVSIQGGTVYLTFTSPETIVREVYSSTGNNTKGVEVITVNPTQLYPESLIDKYVSPLRSDRTYPYYPLDDFYNEGVLMAWGGTLSVNTAVDTRFDLSWTPPQNDN